MSEQLNILNQDPTVEQFLRDPTFDMTEEITQGPSKYTIWRKYQRLSASQRVSNNNGSWGTRRQYCRAPIVLSENPEYFKYGNYKKDIVRIKQNIYHEFCVSFRPTELVITDNWNSRYTYK
ncbi:hypothetical protein BDC45DRAFT_532485 [Circinella umbellata]|nr:hypothetical protein BDC45DRAFT_532485 [Circinella umbellata]